MNQASPKSDFVLATDPREPPPRLRKAVYAIGNFDGVHLGHRAVIARTKALAARREAPSAVLTFEPHPADHFVGRPVVFRLTPFAAKVAAIEALGVDGLVCLSFDAALAGMPAEAFVEQILVGALDIGAAVVGWDFHFGKNRSGSPAFLQRAGARFGFEVDVVARVETPEMTAVSSSAARRALEQGDVEAAVRCLGTPLCRLRNSDRRPEARAHARRADRQYRIGADQSPEARGLRGAGERRRASIRRRRQFWRAPDGR